MDISQITSRLRKEAGAGVSVYERRPGEFHVILPIFHEDGDRVDIYIRETPHGGVRIYDCGMTLMRLSYTFEIGSETRQRTFNNILANNGVKNDGGNLYLDSPVNTLYQSMLQFAGCVQKVCNMRYWSRQTVRSAFYEDLKDCTVVGLKKYTPVADVSPLPDYELIVVDWALKYNKKDIFLFGVKGNDKAKNAAISLLEFKQAKLNFLSIIVHDDMDALGRKESGYLRRHADKQYGNLDEFREDAAADIERIAA